MFPIVFRPSKGDILPYLWVRGMQRIRIVRNEYTSLHIYLPRASSAKHCAVFQGEVQAPKLVRYTLSELLVVATNLGNSATAMDLEARLAFPTGTQ